MPQTHFDEWIAKRYERLWPELFDPALIELTVEFLAQLAGPGPALELGVEPVESRCPSAGEEFGSAGSNYLQPWSAS